MAKIIADAADRLWGAFDLPLRAAVFPFAVLAGTLAVYAAARNVLLAIATTSTTNSGLLDAVALIAAVALSNIRYSDMSAPLRPIARGIGAVVSVQMAFDCFSLIYGPATLLNGVNGIFFVACSILAVMAGILGQVRPSFLLPLFFHYVAFRHQLGIVSGIDISQTDYLSMLDIGEFVVLGAAVTYWATSRAIPSIATFLGDDRERARTAASALIWAWAVGAHLGNYFVSGWTKVRAGGSDPLFWLTNNPTQTSILIGLERGDNPLAQWPWLVQLSWDSIVAGGILLNLFVLATQLAAPLAVLHRRTLMTVTLLYDAFHFGVYLTLGALFHFWIAVNLLIFMSARRMTDRSLTPAVQFTAIAAVFVGHLGFYTSHLGWLDGAKLASPTIVAETADGRRVPVPSVFFGINSYSIAQTVMYIPDGHFPMRMGGNTYNRTDWQEAQTCGDQMAAQQDTGVGWPAVVKMVQEHDAAMRRHPIVKNMNLYYAYPHHMVANPLVFGTFNSLSMNDIVRYRYVVESVCLSLRDGHLMRDVRFRTEEPIDVAR